MLTPNNYWFKIPNWHAGLWKSDFQTTYYSHDFNGAENLSTDTFEAIQERISGHQIDAAGNIWHFGRTNYWSTTECNLFNAFDLVKSHECSYEQNTIIEYSHSIEVRAFKKSNRIFLVRQKECISILKKITPTFIRCDASIKYFDRDGKPLMHGKNLLDYKKISNFKKYDSLDGRNLKILFNEYLESHGMVDLIPQTKTAKAK